MNDICANCRRLYCDIIAADCLLKPVQISRLRPDLILMPEMPRNKKAEQAVYQQERRKKFWPKKPQKARLTLKQRAKSGPADRREYYRNYYRLHRDKKIAQAMGKYFERRLREQVNA